MKVEDLKPRGVKAPMWLLPFQGLRAVSAAFAEGAAKYGPYNWREQGKLEDWKRTYVSAGLRHLHALADPGEDDYDTGPGGSGLYHGALAGACCLILCTLAGADYMVPNAAKEKHDV